MKICKVTDCGRRHYAKGFCGLHWNRWKKNGDPLKVTMRHDGEGTFNELGYKIIHVNGKRVREHRHIMSLHIGRPLTRTEVVHHKDGNPKNNAIENLELLESQSVHMVKHRTYFFDDVSKECSVCRKILPRASFYQHSQGNDSWFCKDCYREWAKPRRSEYYRKNRDTIRRKAKEVRERSGNSYDKVRNRTRAVNSKITKHLMLW